MSQHKEYKDILFEWGTDGIAKITLNNPNTLNALTTPMLAEIRDAISIVQSKPEIKVVILTGAGRGFCSGANLDRGTTTTTPKTSVSNSIRSHFNPLIVEMQNCTKLIIAQINGVSAGAGFSLALASDFRVCAKSASFISAFIRIGLVPDCGLSYFLPRIVGTTRAMEIMTLGETVSSDKALDWGIVNQVVPEAQLDAEVKKLALKLVQGLVASRGWTKKLVTPADGELLIALENEARLQELAIAQPDFAERIKRFTKAKL